MKPNATKLPEILGSKLAAIHDICRKYHVKYLWVFGSVLTDEFREEAFGLVEDWLDVNRGRGSSW